MQLSHRDWSVVCDSSPSRLCIFLEFEWSIEREVERRKIEHADRRPVNSIATHAIQLVSKYIIKRVYLKYLNVLIRAQAQAFVSKYIGPRFVSSLNIRSRVNEYCIEIQSFIKYKLNYK